MTTGTVRGSTKGWLVFGITVGMVIALFNLMYGIVLIFKDTWVVLTTDGLLVFDLAAWGWIMLILGAVQLYVLYGVSAGKKWARIAGIVWAVVIMLTQIAAITIYPLWSLVMIAACFFVIYALAAQGDDIV